MTGRKHVDKPKNRSRRLTWTPGISETPAIAVDPSDHLYLIWVDTTPGYYEIYYKMSADAGTTWTASRRLTWTSGSSMRLAVTADTSGYIHLVWQDETPGNYEIYYKKGS